jgi:hypothetical protein
VARESAPAWRVALKAGELLGGALLVREGSLRAPLSTIVRGQNLDEVTKIDIGLRLYDTTLRISEPPEPLSQIIRIPKTSPLLLEVRWKTGRQRHQRVISFAPASTQMVRDVESRGLRVCTAARDSYWLEPAKPQQIKNTPYTVVAASQGLTLRV